jgi:hypothetical protein
VEEDLQALNEGLATKASQDDLLYFRKELASKLEKTELEAFR